MLSTPPPAYAVACSISSSSAGLIKLVLGHCPPQFQGRIRGGGAYFKTPPLFFIDCLKSYLGNNLLSTMSGAYLMGEEATRHLPPHPKKSFSG